LATLAGHSGPILAVAYSPKGDVVATGAEDGTARLWSAKTGELLHTLRAHGAVLATEFDAAGGRLATLGTDRAGRVWDVGGGRAASGSTLSRRTRAASWISSSTATAAASQPLASTERRGCGRSGTASSASSSRCGATRTR